MLKVTYSPWLKPGLYGAFGNLYVRRIVTYTHLRNAATTNECFMQRLRVWFLIVVTVSVLASGLVAYAQDGTVHIVRDGETLTSIAQRYHTSVDALIAANHLKDGDNLYVGQRLLIPGTTTRQVTVKSSPGTYIVQAGDTLIGIANQYGISVDQLMAANKLTDPSLVRIGQTLKIPGQSDSVASTLPPLPDGQQTLTPAANGPAIAVEIANGHLVSLTLQTVSSGKQSLPLTCEAKIASQLAMMYGLNFDEASFLSRLPHSLNPQRGFVGAVNGRFYWPADIVGGTANGPGGYGVHVEGWKTTFEALSGFQVRLLSSNPTAAQTQIDSALRHGYPVAVWAILGFRANIARNSVWIGATADGTVIDCGGPAPNCYYLASGEHAYLILGRNADDYIVYDPGKGDITNYPRSTVITGITTLFAVPTGSAPGGIIVPRTGSLPDLSRLPTW